MQTLFDLTGKTALITGAWRGIGFALAGGLADAGANILINGRDEGKAARAVAALRESGYTASELVFDVADNEATIAAIDGYEASHGPIDIIINNAGIQHRSSLMEFDAAAFDRVLATNTQGVFHVSRAAVRHMAKRGQGKIINIASIMSKMARHHVSAYITSKAAVAGLTRAMTSEWAEQGINCNAIGPGYISTELTQSLFTDQAFSQWLTDNTPAGRWGEVQDLIGTAIYLAAPASDFVHGQIIYVDGGMTSTV
ncbi:SDR family oxidoreductase [Alphaproteobacteria bacterium]|nr:SDR family oxidoreductase [Alphaproteobacteria bacterium]